MSWEPWGGCGPLEWGLGAQQPLPPLQLGFHLCLVGWLADGSAAYPIVFPAPGCGDGRVGIISLGVQQDLSERWDAYCYREQGVSPTPWPCAFPPTCHPPSPSPQMWPASADVASWVTGPACATENCLMCWLPPPTSLPFTGCAGARARGGRPRGAPAHSLVSSPSQMLLHYANATPRGLDFLDFLDDELTFKTLFVPVNEGFVDNMVTSEGHGRAGRTLHALVAQASSPCFTCRR